MCRNYRRKTNMFGGLCAAEFPIICRVIRRKHSLCMLTNIIRSPPERDAPCVCARKFIVRHCHGSRFKNEFIPYLMAVLLIRTAPHQKARYWLSTNKSKHRRPNDRVPCVYKHIRYSLFCCCILETWKRQHNGGWKFETKVTMKRLRKCFDNTRIE
jgi:hypothetical protein